MTDLADSDIQALINLDATRAQGLAGDIAAAPGFPHFCIDDFLNPDFAHEISDSYPTFEDAAKVGRSFNAHYEKRKIQVTDSSVFPDPVKKLNDIFASEYFRKLVSDMTGIDELLYDEQLAGGGMHLTHGGGRLDVHVDFNFVEDRQWYRRVNLLLYLNEQWNREWGGELELWDADVKNCLNSFEPKFNRLCGFVTSEISFHGVTPVNSPDAVPRKSFATYYYTADRPDTISPEHHTTIFRPRPDEAMRDTLVRPVSDLQRKAGKLASRAAKKLGL